MAISVLFEIPGMTQEQYDRLIKELEAAGVKAPGRLYHIAGPGEGFWQALDVFESQQAFEQFINGGLGPTLQRMGVASPSVRITPVHNIITGPDHHL